MKAHDGKVDSMYAQVRLRLIILKACVGQLESGGGWWWSSLCRRSPHQWCIVGGSVVVLPVQARRHQRGTLDGRSKRCD